MTATEKLRKIRAHAAELAESDTAKRAAFLHENSAKIAQLEKGAETERLALRAAVGGPLAVLGDAAAAAGPDKPKPARWHEEMSQERLARRGALNPLLGAGDALADRQRRERDER